MSAAIHQRSARAQAGRSTLRFIPSAPPPSLYLIVDTSYVIRNHGYLFHDMLFATDAEFRIRKQMVEAGILCRMG